MPVTEWTPPKLLNWLWLLSISSQRGTKDTPNSMGAERRKPKGKRKQTQATKDTSTPDRPLTHPHRSAKAIEDYA
jgi:hypothetical protein